MSASVSVIIPTYNRPHLLPRAIASAKAAGDDVEVVVVDDASVDETATVCKQISGIKYIRLQLNQGVAGARNIGIFCSSSPNIAFLDDDDLRVPGSLDLQLAALKANPEVGLVCGAMLMADQDYLPTGESFSVTAAGHDVFTEMLELSCPLMPLSVVIRKECFTRVGLLNGHLDGVDDWDIFVRIAELFPVVSIDAPVGIYRKPSPSSLQGSSAQSGQLLRAFRHQLRLLELPRGRAMENNQRQALRQRTKERVTDTLLLNALRQLPAREYAFVCSNIRAAFRVSPRRVINRSVRSGLLRPSALNRRAYE